MTDACQPVAVYAIAGPSDWPKVFTFVNTLLRGGRRVLMCTEEGSPNLPQGSFVIPLAKSFDPWFKDGLTLNEVKKIASQISVNVQSLQDSEDIVVVPLRLIHIGIYGGAGSPFNHAAVLAECGFPVRFLSDSDVRAGRLKAVDIFVMPGGGARSVIGQIEPLGEEGCLAISEFVRLGGMYIGSCAGSYGCIINSKEFYQACPAQIHLQLLNARPSQGDSPKGRFGFHSPGVGIVVLRNEMPHHPVMFGMPDEFPIVHYNGPVLESSGDMKIRGASEMLGLASFSGWNEQFTPSENFHGEDCSKDETFLEDSIVSRRFSIVVGGFGLGRVVAFGSHPEFGFDLPMVEWGQPARMLANAVMWRSWFPAIVGNLPPPDSNATCGLPVGSSLERIITAADSIVALAMELQRRSINPPPHWLTPAYALSIFGREPEEIWTRAIDEIIRLASETLELATRLKERIVRRISTLSASEIRALEQIERWALDQRAVEWRQDLGYQGARALLVKTARMCEAGLANWDIDLGSPRGSYDFLGENPYHLVAGSYMAAIGHVAGARQLLRGMTAEWLMAERIESEANQAHGFVG